METFVEKNENGERYSIVFALGFMTSWPPWPLGLLGLCQGQRLRQGQRWRLEAKAKSRKNLQTLVAKVLNGLNCC